MQLEDGHQSLHRPLQQRGPLGRGLSRVRVLSYSRRGEEGCRARLTFLLGLLAVLIAAVALSVQEVPAAVVDEAVRVLRKQQYLAQCTSQTGVARTRYSGHHDGRNTLCTICCSC